ncbi:MAG: hypothetical protein EOP19_05135 [Hyphomicrobiales bacterium]|nr:MAG: hypothetical protein EOP19_05135 [Hyphomicrobiales bacterium]
MRNLLTCLAFVTMTLPAAAQTVSGTPAVEGTPEWLVGDAVLYFVNGRTREAAGGADFNPFGIDPDSVLFHVGAFFVVGDFTGEGLKEGELALYPQFLMPRGEGTPSAETPPIMPFALLQQGACHGGYVTGFPVPDTTYTVDMTDLLCHADTVEQLVYDAYAGAAASEPTEPTEPDPEPLPAPAGFDPAFPSDQQLQDAVYAAYNAAYGLALQDPDYAFWDGSDFAPVREAVAAALADAGLAQISLAESPGFDPVAARACADPGTTALRIAFTPDRSGITVAAASATHVYAYDYDQEISAELRVTELRECATSGPGRARSRSY